MGSKRSMILFLTFVALGSHVYSLPLENEQPIVEAEQPVAEDAPTADALSVGVEGSGKNATEKLWPFFPFPASITALFPTPSPQVVIGQPAPPAPIIFINPPPAPTPPPTTTTTTPPPPPPAPAPAPVPANRTSESEVEVSAPVAVESESSANEENKDEKLFFPLLTLNAQLPPFPAFSLLRPPASAPVVSVPPPAPYLIFPPGSASGTDITVVNPPNNNPIVVTQGTGAVVTQGSAPTATVVQPVPVNVPAPNAVITNVGAPTAIVVPQSSVITSNPSPSTVVANVGPANSLVTSDPATSQNALFTSQNSFVLSLPPNGLLGGLTG